MTSAPAITGRLEEWTLYCAGIIGTVYEHQDYPDGKEILTSVIVAVDPTENIVMTKSGSCYRLGKPVGDCGMNALRKLWAAKGDTSAQEPAKA
jgi:hypothetical protein